MMRIVNFSEEFNPEKEEELLKFVKPSAIPIEPSLGISFNKGNI